MELGWRGKCGGIHSQFKYSSRKLLLVNHLCLGGLGNTRVCRRTTKKHDWCCERQCGRQADSPERSLRLKPYSHEVEDRASNGVRFVYQPSLPGVPLIGPVISSVTQPP